MASDEIGSDIEGIDEELEKIQAFLSTTPSPDESMQMLARQSALLVAKAGAYRRRGAFDAALKTAMEAASLIDSLRGPAHRLNTELGFDLEEIWFEAHSAVGLAEVQSRDLVAARKTLRFLHKQLGRAKKPKMRAVHVAALEHALDNEAEERLRTFYAQAADSESEAEHKVLGHNWDESNIILDTLVDEIAERIAFASSLAGRVSHPEQFQEFLVQRLRGSLLRTRQRPVDEILNVESSIRQKAQERGKRLQISAWKSSEMLLAGQLRFPDGTVCTGEALAHPRDGFRILGLPHPDDASIFAYPRWQFGEHHQVVISILQELKSLPAWSVWHFFHQGLAYLFDLSPLDVLRPIQEDHNAPRLARLLAEHGSVEQTLLAAAKNYVSGRD